mgnify:CR=1 FL=1
MPSKSSKEMTLNEEWELMKQMADKQNAAITEAIEELRDEESRTNVRSRMRERSFAAAQDDKRMFTKLPARSRSAL